MSLGPVDTDPYYMVVSCRQLVRERKRDLRKLKRVRPRETRDGDRVAGAVNPRVHVTRGEASLEDHAAGESFPVPAGVVGASVSAL